MPRVKNSAHGYFEITGSRVSPGRVQWRLVKLLMTSTTSIVSTSIQCMTAILFYLTRGLTFCRFPSQLLYMANLWESLKLLLLVTTRRLECIFCKTRMTQWLLLCSRGTTSMTVLRELGHPPEMADKWCTNSHNRYVHCYYQWWRHVKITFLQVN